MKKDYMFKFLLISLFVCVRLSTVMAQETGSVSGKVVDDKGEGVVGALVIDEGTQQGTAADIDGNFKLGNLKEGEHTILIKSMGLSNIRKKVTIKGGENVSLDVLKMQESAKQLKEVVVVGYGTAVKREVTGSIAKVGAKELENVPVPSFDAALQGRAAGLQVVQSSGVAGGQVRVRVRGQASVSGNGDPLYVIDGIPVTNGDFSSKVGVPTSATGLNPLSSINPDDIESIEVLKDAAAGAIYGARAANGVILVTTKRGKAGKSEFNFNYSTGITTPARMLKLLNGDQWQQLYLEAYRNDSLDLVKTNPKAKPKPFATSLNDVPITQKSFYNKQFKDGTPFGNTDWLDEMLQIGRTQDVSLSARGGTEKTTYYISGDYNKNDGMLKGNSFQRISGRINVDSKATEKLTLGTQVGLYYTDNNQVPTSYNGGIGAAQSTALPIFPVYNPNGTYFGQQLSPPQNYFNPVAQLESKFNTSTFRSLSNIYLEYKFTPDLAFRTQGGLDYMDMFETFYFSPINRYYQDPKTKKYVGLGAAQERRVNVYNFTTNSTITYTKRFKELHKVTALAGTDIQGSTQKDIGFYPAQSFVGFNDPYFTTATTNMTFYQNAPDTLKRGPTVGGYNDRNFYRFASFFTRVNYVLKDRYVVQLSLRSDGSSRFGANHRFGYFPAVSASWIITDEPFMTRDSSFMATHASWISMLKLRASYGLTGNSEIPNFAWLGSYGQTGGYLGTQGLAPTRLSNPDLTWETTRQFDLGLDYGFLRDRITGTIGFYHKVGTGILLNRPVQVSATGFSRMTVNSNVEVRNMGWEFSITSRNIINPSNDPKKLSWTTDLNMSGNSNKVLNVDGIPPDGFESGEGDTRIIEGQPVGISFLAKYAGINPETGYEQIYDLNGNKVDLTPKTAAKVQQANRVAVGKPFPDFVGGINNTFGFMNFDLSFLFTFSYGNTIYDDGAKYQYGSRIGSWNQRAETMNRWQKPGDVTDVPKLTLSPFNPDQDNTTRFLYDGSYIRLRTLALGYKLPEKWVSKAKIRTCRVFLMGQNLFVITKYPGWDPEVVRYADKGDAQTRNNQSNISFAAPYLSTPQARTITMGVNIGF